MDDSGRAPGWYPDPGMPGRHRHWDGRRWSALTTAQLPSALKEPAPDLHPVPRRRVPAIWAAATIAVVVLGGLALAARVALDRETAAPPREASAPAASVPDQARAPDDVHDAGDAPGRFPEGPGGAPDDAAAEPPLAPCTVDPATLLEEVRASPPLTQVAPSLTVSDVVCLGEWATATVAAPDTDRALAVFRNTDGRWRLLLVGNSQPCEGLGVPADAKASLGCDLGAGPS